MSLSSQALGVRSAQTQREMGKYIRKAKTTGELAVMEVSQSSLGVRTRARTLALQKSPAPPPSPSPPAASGSYLQLRSRRLEKPPVALSTQDSGTKRHKQAASNPRAGSSLRVGSHGPKGVDQEAEEVEKEEDLQEKNEKSGNNNNGDLGVEEASFGENVLEFEGRERWVFFFFFFFSFIGVFSFFGGFHLIFIWDLLFWGFFVFSHSLLRENEGKWKKLGFSIMGVFFSSFLLFRSLVGKGFLGFAHFLLCWEKGKF